MHARWAWSTIFAVAFASACGAPHGEAQPPGFPDLGGLTDVTSDYTSSSGRGAVGVQFSTPQGGFSCGFGMPHEVTPDSQLVQCTGLLPGIANIPIPYGSTQGECDLGNANPSPVGIYHYKGECRSGGGNKVLNPGQKVHYGNITCGVISADVTACLDTSNGEHGFVLQPSGSWAF